MENLILQQTDIFSSKLQQKVGVDDPVGLKRED